MSKGPITDKKVTALGSGDNRTISLIQPDVLSMDMNMSSSGTETETGQSTGTVTGKGKGEGSPLISKHIGNDSDSEGGDSPPPPPPSPPPGGDDDDRPPGGGNDLETSQNLLEETKKWEDLGLTHRFLTVIKRTSNASQLEAVYRSVSCTGFTLIQGPPGTGKTSTILNILNAFHIREYDKYYRIAVDIFLGEEGVRCRRSQDLGPW